MLDREKVIKEKLDEMVELTRGLSYAGFMTAVENASDILALLKEREIVPYIDIDEAKCPNCKVKLTRQELLGDDVLFEDFYDYCPHCGKKVNWTRKEDGHAAEGGKDPEL